MKFWIATFSMCCCRDTYGAPPVHSCFNCSLQRFGVSAHGVVSVLSFSKSGQDLVTDFCVQPKENHAHAWLKDLRASDPLFVWEPYEKIRSGALDTEQFSYAYSATARARLVTLLETR